MPTYADLYNERLLALGQAGPSNPVRLTISKGDYVWDPQTSRFRYEEQWEEEHLMDHEELTDNDELAAPALYGQADSRESTPPMSTALQPMTLHGHVEGLIHHPSLWVLDTNTLMSCLELLKALFAALLTRNVTYAAAIRQHAPASAHPIRPSLIKLVIPYVVVSELDGLKITRRKDDSGRPVASHAREANHWLLSAIQKQKRVPVDETGANLPEELWPLFVQTSSHYNRSKKRANGTSSRWEDPISCDDEIVKFCVDLKGQTPSGVCFCSDDINARTKAELDGIDSLGMRELANAQKMHFRDVQSSERKWMLVADAIIEQWEYQISTLQQPGADSDCQQQQLRGIHHFTGQQPWQTNEVAAQHNAPGQTILYTQTAHASNRLRHATSVPAPNDILEIDMDTEEQQPVRTDPKSIQLVSVHPAAPSMRTTLSTEGRGTTDSIHSPRNTQQANKSEYHRTPGISDHQQLPISTVDKNTSAVSEELNPQISWEELMQQVGASPRSGGRARNGRW